ncbi:MAG: class II aldolase/adducin family protein [Candidatus Electrothrix sp. GW3-4]|uniref:class II aldolase/adducin family protein n=1 Tax=Candidatus Electrothrix sp. GW3-4 TaxID=3126740 RepID=UPI0030D2E9C2
MNSFINTAHKTAQHDLVLCGSGNLSCRKDEQHMLISTSGSWLSDLTEEQIAICRIEDGVCINGKAPSIEIGFHQAVLKQRRDINTVLHFQSPYATTLACSKDTESAKDLPLIPELPYYIGPVATVPYMTPGSDELAQAVTSALQEHDLVVLQNHGQVTVGKDYPEMLQRALFFEFAAAIYFRTNQQPVSIDEQGINFLHQARQNGFP